MAQKTQIDESVDKPQSVRTRFTSYLSKRKKRSIAIFIILAVVGWAFRSGRNTAIEVDLMPANKGEVIESVSASGEVTAEEKTTLVFQTAGKLSWVNVSEGQTIKKGHAVAGLDKKQLEATLKKYLNTSEREFTEFDDSNDEIEDAVLSDAVKRIKSRAQIDLNQSVIDVEIQSETLKLATLYSPISGIVTSANPKYSGINVGPTTASYEVVNPDTVYFEAKVNEVDIAKVKTGLPVTLQLDAYVDETLTEAITDISFESTTTSTGATAYIVKISLPENNDMKYRLGMNGDAEIILSKKTNVLLVPQTAIVEIDDKTYIWISNNGIAQKVEVETGISSINEIEVTKGIEEGNIIINRPPITLNEGAKVIEQTEEK